MSWTRRVIAAGTCGTVALVAVSPLRAQGPLLVEAFAARAEPSTAPLFGGLALSGYRGPFGLRVGGALHLAGDRNAAGATAFGDTRCGRFDCEERGGRSGGHMASAFNVGAWTADADLLVEPLRTVPALRSLLLGFSPYAFAGIGRYAVRPSGAADTNVTAVSYGAGVHHQLLGWLGLSAEARIRRPLQGDSSVSAAALRRSAQWRNAQYRVGLTVSFGGRRPARPTSAAPSLMPVPMAGNAAPCAGAACAPPPAVVPPTTSGSAPGASATIGVVPRVLDLADGYLNTPYRAGGMTPADGFDGAGFVGYVFGREGVQLPRTAREMAEAGVAVPTRAGALRPGDLLLFANDGTTVDHVAIYVGRDRIVHATASGGGVRYDVLGDGARGRWFADHLVGARRVVTADQDRTRQGGDAAPPPGAPAR